MIEIRDDIKSLFPESTVDEFMGIEGEVVKHVVEDRRILRIERGQRAFYLKLHFGVGWKEILKNLVSLKLPVLGAGNERNAIRAFEKLGVDTMTLAGYGRQGINPARQRSFLLTDALVETQDLETWLPELCACGAEGVRLKRAVIRKVAQQARTLHEHGINHRDFYLCHFRVDLSKGRPAPESLRLYVMDLHRVQIRSLTPLRWRVKDIGALLFSALHPRQDAGLTRNDYLRFVETYGGQPWRESLKRDRRFWRKVLHRAAALHRKTGSTRPALPPYMTWVNQVSS